MSPRRLDLFDVVENQNLGVEVADGHLIKCTTTGKVKINMLDDDGNQSQATLHDAMYVPGLRERVHSITTFADHGHGAFFKKNA